jgi:hypothetical protein
MLAVKEARQSASTSAFLVAVNLSVPTEAIHALAAPEESEMSQVSASESNVLGTAFSSNEVTSLNIPLSGRLWLFEVAWFQWIHHVIAQACSGRRQVHRCSCFLSATSRK